MSEHTPGPWEVEVLPPKDTDDGNTMTAITAYGDDGAILAEVNRWTFGDSPAQPESDANARLIAAAPDLLAACETMEAHLTSFTRNYRTTNECQMLNHARAAIAKAKPRGER